MWTVEQWVALGGVIALVLTALAGMTKAIADLIASWRKRDVAPAPQVGIPAPPPAPAPATDDIDYRAYLDVLKRAEKAEAQVERLLRIMGRYGDHIDEDTHPIPPKETS